MEAKPKMEYRYMGGTGLKVSILGFGNWVTGHSEEEEKTQIEIIKKAYESGINFFDTAEVYGFGVAETIMGKAIKNLDARREDLVISTKIFMASPTGANDKFLSRKHIIEGVNNSLKRLQLDYVDIIFAHRPDFETSLEETCKAFHWVIE
jgi:voltage-dependent potassium channel beta subunit